MKYLIILLLFSYAGWGQTKDIYLQASPPAYNGKPEKIEISLADLEKAKSLKDIQPSYATNYEIESFEVTLLNPAGNSNIANCMGSYFTPDVIGYINKVKGYYNNNNKSYAKLFIDNIAAKDIKTNKVVTLQSLKIIVK